MGIDVVQLGLNAVDGWASQLVLRGARRVVAGTREAFRDRPGRVVVVAAMLTGAGCSLVTVHYHAPRPTSHYALPFAPDDPYVQRSADPPAKEVPAILAPGRRGSAGADPATARVVAPYDYPAARLSALLLTDADVTAIAPVTPLDREPERAYVLRIHEDPRPCGDSSVRAHPTGDDPYLVWRMTGSTAGSVTHFASSATELVSPTEANGLVHDVATAGCGYTRHTGVLDGRAFVRLSWRDPEGAYRDLVLIRDGNVILQVATSQDDTRHAHYADLLARRLLAKWDADRLAPDAPPTPSPDAAPASMAPRDPHSPDPEPTGTPPQRPGCLPLVCANVPEDTSVR